MSDQDDEEPLDPETRAAMQRSTFGRGLLYIRAVGPERFWERFRHDSAALAYAAGCATFLVVAHVLPLRGIRWAIALIIGFYSVGVWLALTSFVIVYLVGLFGRSSLDETGQPT